MSKKRWYDNDPTLSMAVSLLQNAIPVYQEMTAKYILKYMEREGILKEYSLTNQQIRFVFPFIKRNRMNQDAWEMMETLKRLPRQLQLDVSLQMINYIYMLDSGETLEERSEETLTHPIKEISNKD